MLSQLIREDELISSSHDGHVVAHNLQAIDQAIVSRRKRMDEGTKLAQEFFQKSRDEAKSRKKKESKKKSKK